MDFSGLLLADVLTNNLLAARLQMALTLGFHITLAVFGVGMPVLMLGAEWFGLRYRDPVWMELARRWSKAFAVLFAVGAVSGTVLSFELGLLWPEFMGRFGSVIALPFTLEGFAFFLEAIFVGIYLYGWNRLPGWAHWWAGVPIAVSGAASAWFVVTVNAWMNSPTGFRMEGNRVVDIDPIAAMFNAATPMQTTHMLLAAYMTSGFVIASFHAYALLRGRPGGYHRRALALALTMAGSATPLQLLVGDWAAKTVARDQPIKFAALEGHFQTEAYAPLQIGGWPDAQRRETPWAIKIPGMLSFLAHGRFDAEVAGLDDFPADEQPPVAVVHLAFQTMVGVGVYLLLLTIYTAWIAWRRRGLPSSRWYLWSVVLAGPLCWLALEAGWVVTEVGRQPWIVHGVARTADMVTDAPGVTWVLAITLSIYAVLAAGTVLILQLLARIPLPEHARDA